MAYLSEKIDQASEKVLKDNTIGKIIGRRAAKELRVDDIVNIGIGIPEMVSAMRERVACSIW